MDDEHGVVSAHRLAQELGHTWAQLETREVVTAWYECGGDFEAFCAAVTAACDRFESGPAGIGICAPKRGVDWNGTPCWVHTTTTGRSTFWTYDSGETIQIVRRPSSAIAVYASFSVDGGIIEAIVTRHARLRHVEAIGLDMTADHYGAPCSEMGAQVYTTPIEILRDADVDLAFEDGERVDRHALMAFLSEGQNNDVERAARTLVAECERLFGPHYNGERARLHAVKSVLSAW